MSRAVIAERTLVSGPTHLTRREGSAAAKRSVISAAKRTQAATSAVPHKPSSQRVSNWRSAPPPPRNAITSAPVFSNAAGSASDRSAAWFQKCKWPITSSIVHPLNAVFCFSAASSSGAISACSASVSSLKSNGCWNIACPATRRLFRLGAQRLAELLDDVALAIAAALLHYFASVAIVDERDLVDVERPARAAA